MFFPRCVHPLTIFRDKKRHLFPVSVPCGQCVACRLRHASSWATRAMMEYKSSGSLGCFLTLTYDDDHLPADGCVSKRELQLYLKRARHTFGRFRYLACGEYGEESRRPHYHLLLFGVDADHPVFARWHVVGNGRRGHLADWPYGLCHIGYVEEQSCLYVCKYAVKSYHVLVDGLTPPFLLMSRRPGLGKQYALAHRDAIERGTDPIVACRSHIDSEDLDNYAPALPRYIQAVYDEYDEMCDFDESHDAGWYREYRQLRSYLRMREVRNALVERSRDSGMSPEEYQRREDRQRGLDLAGRVGDR